MDAFTDHSLLISDLLVKLSIQNRFSKYSKAAFKFRVFEALVAIIGDGFNFIGTGRMLHCEKMP